MDNSMYTFTAADAEKTIDLDTLSEKGLLSVTFAPRRDLWPVTVSGTPVTHPIINGGDLSLMLFERKGVIHMGIKLFKGMRHYVTGSITHLKKGATYTCAFRWDGTSTELFEFYINGNANGVEDWQLPGAFGAQPGMSSVTVGPALDLAIREIVLVNREPTVPELAQYTRAEGCLDITTEARTDIVKDFDISGLTTEKLYSCAFDKPEDLEDWVLEGGGTCEIEDNRLVMASSDPDSTAHQVLWNKKDFPADFLAEWNISRTVDRGLTIVIFAAKGVNGEDVFDPKLAKRTGDFKEYHSGDIRTYHISYYAWGRTTNNLRKNIGMHLGAIGNDLVSKYPVNEKVKISLLKKGAHITLAVNGKIALEYHDDGKRYGPVWEDGKIALRQMAHAVKVYYNDFTVYAVK